MRSALCSRALRPKLHGSSPIAIPKKVPITRQTTSATTRRGVTLNDVFTLLLTPILATALLADTSWKDKRRKDWAQQIAQIEAETEEIQSRALQSWQALQSRSLSLGAAQQRRYYSSAIARPLMSTPGGEEMPGVEIGDEPEWFEARAKESGDAAVKPQDTEEKDCIEPRQQAEENSDRLRRLLAIKLALNLTIYINTGVSPSKIRREIRIPDWNEDFTFDLDRYQELNTLMKQMRSLCSSVEHLKLTLPEGAVPVRHESMNEHLQELQNEICHISEQYRTRNLTLTEFITKYTVAILRSTVAPTSRAYLALFRGLASGSGLDQPSHDLAMQTLFTWEQSKLPICDSDLFVILTELARRKHVQKFDGLMRDLTMSPSVLNMPRWTWERVNDVQVPVPVSHHPALLITLVHCALRFDQPQKAEAWSEILRKTWVNINDPTQRTPLSRFFTNWMRYYEVQGNWRKGLAWLDAAQKWIISIASFDMYSLQRLAVGMLSLCFACGKAQEYEEILSAAVDSGLPPMNPSHYLERSARRAISKEWGLLYDEAYGTRGDLRTDREKVQAFQRKVRLMAQRLLPDKDSADLEWRREQKDKSNPLMPILEAGESDQSLTEAVTGWKLLYSKNQRAIQDATVVAETWKERYLAQQREALSLRNHLQFLLRNQLHTQKTGVKRLKGLRMQTSPPYRVEIDETEDAFIPQSVKFAPIGNEQPDWTTTDSLKGSPFVEPKRINKKSMIPDDSDDFLISRLVES
jgi:hypothetical protein